MTYRLLYTEMFEQSLQSLDRQDAVRIVEKMTWLAENAEEIQHERLTNPPRGLEGVCKRRVGSQRIIYWVDHEAKEIVGYDVLWRRGKYRDLYW
jgi:mRNA-degrading endonuclease RelE of RelBE toxin-antitoxin system